MAGHSKWANIKHKKAAQDAKRGKLFTRLIREISVAARLGDPDTATNPRLRNAVQNALSQNMARDTIERAIRKGSGNEQTTPEEDARYEGYAPGGVAVLVECMTDNRNRTAGDVRNIFSRLGGNLGTNGSVSYLFDKKGFIYFDDSVGEEQILEPALEAGAEDVRVHEEGGLEVITPPENVYEVQSALEEAGLASLRAETTMEADIKVPVNAERAETLLKMIDRFEDLDDVQNVYTNAEISAEVLAQTSYGG